MAIFGTLEDLSLTEVLPTLIRRNGKLLVWGLPSGVESEIHIYNSQITALIVDRKPLELFDAHRFFHELAANRIGNFEFFNAKSEVVVQHFQIGLAQLLAGHFERSASITSEINYFPDPQTYFVTTNRTNESFLGFELDDFWVRAYTFLLSGANAEELAKRFNLPINEVQAYLYRLRGSGRIQPLRAFHRTATPAVALASSIKENLTIDFDIEFDVVPEIPTPPTPDIVPRDQGLVVNQKSEKPQKSAGILGRLIKALGIRK